LKRRNLCYLATLLLAMTLAGCNRSAPDKAAVTPTTLSPPTLTLKSSLVVATTVQPPLSGTPLAVSVTPLPAPSPLPPSACAPADPESTEAIVIGAILPLSRPGAFRAGFHMQAAFNIALQDINRSGGVQGRQIRVITYDSAGVPRRGALFAERLITLDCASAIVGLYHSNVAAAVSDVADRYGIPLILAAPQADELTAAQRQSVFRVGPTFSMQDQQLAAWLTDVVSIEPDPFLIDEQMTVVIVAENRELERNETERMIFWLEDAGFTAKSIFVDLPTQDYSPVIARIVTLDAFPDVVVNRLTDQPALDFHQQLLQAGVSPNNGTIIVTGEHALDDERFWAAIPEGDKTVIRRDGPWSNTITEAGRDFSREYEELFRHWPKSDAFTAYDALRLIADAMNRSTTLAFPDVVDALESTDVGLATGRYYFPYGSDNPPEGDRMPDFLWHQWPDPPLLYLQYDAPQQSSTDMPVLWPPVYRTADGPYIP